MGDQADEQAGPLAYHFSAAGDVAKAYQYHSRAAVAAQLVCAVEPALTHCTEALDAASRLGLDAHHEPALRVLLFQRGRLRWRSGDLDGATADLDAKDLPLDPPRQIAEQAEDVHAFIRGRIAARDAKIAAATRILYGGSVKAGNAAELFNMPDVDGGLIGGASLKADEFLTILAAVRRG